MSVRQLRERIKSNEYERLSEETKLKLITKEEKNVVDFVKNPIIIKSNNYSELLSERTFWSNTSIYELHR